MTQNTSNLLEQNISVERLKSLYELITRMNSETNLDNLLSFVVDRALLQTGGERGLLLLSDEQGQTLQHVAVTRGEKETAVNDLDEVMRFVSATVIQDVLERGEPTLVANLPTDQRYQDNLSDATISYKRIRSAMAMPLKTAQNLVGLIYIDHPRRAVFKKEDLEFLAAFASQAALAINRARDYQTQIEDLTRLSELSLSVMQALDLDEVLTRIINEANQMLNVENGSVLLLDETSQKLGFAVSVSNGQRVKISARLNLTQGIAGWVVSNAKPACVNDVSADPRWFGEVETGFKTRSILCVPLRHNNQILGALQALNKKNAGGFSARDVALLSSFATSATIAIENARLFEQARQAEQLRALNEIAGALTSSLDLDHILPGIIERVNNLLASERTSVFLIEPHTQELVLRHTNEGDVDIRLPKPWGGIAGWVAANDKPALVNDTLSDPRHLHQVAIEAGYEAHAILCVPIKVEDKVIGVLQVLNKEGHRQFNYRHLNLLIEFSKWAAIAIHNARLFEQREQAYKTLADEQNRRIAAETRGAMAAIILNMAHTMNNVIGAIRVWAAKLEYAQTQTPQTPISRYSKEIQQIKNNTQEALELISDITDPLEPLAIQALDVHQLLNQTIANCWWPDNVKLSKTYATDLPLIQANPEKLEAVFHNLLSNAIQVLSVPGGEICLETKQISPSAIQITVSDDGPGIPPELQDTIFKPGVSGKEGGLGIGLWLVETFIEQFGGNISFTSSAQNGTTFIVTLQIAEAA